MLKCCWSGWYQRRGMSQIPGYYGERTTICFANVVYWSDGLWSCSVSLFCLSPGLSSLHFIRFLSCFFAKQTHICAVRVMVGTSEGNVLGLYLELWPSRSAAVPAQSTPMENPANPAHHRALVWIFKSLHPLHTHTHRPTQLVLNWKHTCHSQEDEIKPTFVFNKRHKWKEANEEAVAHLFDRGALS